MFLPSGQQVQLLEFLTKGYSNKQLATTLRTSAANIEYHIHRLFVLTGAVNRVELAMWWCDRRDAPVRRVYEGLPGSPKTAVG